MDWKEPWEYLFIPYKNPESGKRTGTLCASGKRTGKRKREENFVDQPTSVKRYKNT